MCLYHSSLNKLIFTGISVTVKLENERNKVRVVFNIPVVFRIRLWEIDTVTLKSKYNPCSIKKTSLAAS